MRIHPKKVRTNKIQRSAEQRKKHEIALEGGGVYIFRNITKGELFLNKPTIEGFKRIPPGKTFKGDSYFMKMVSSSHELSLVETIKSNQQEKDEKMSLEKLIVDQPDRITTAGKVEQIVVNPKKVKPLNEALPAKNEVLEQEPDVLLVEDALDGVEII